MLERYLRRLGVSAEPPSVDALFRLHRAQVEQVPYETTWIHLGESWSIDTDDAFERIAVGGRGGYCFHLNGSFARALAGLGYDVSLHVGGVHRAAPNQADMTNHLVLLVAGLPTDDNPGGAWYVDAGLGDALYEPLPLVPGTYRQGPMEFTLTQADGGVGDWHFTHDVRGSFCGMSFESRNASLSEFASRHEQLSTSPESGFVRTVSAQRRQREAVTMLRALTFTRHDVGSTSSRVVSDRDEWFAVLRDDFLLDLAGVEPQRLDRLWERANSAHQAFIAGRL